MNKKSVLSFVFTVFSICFVLRLMEYFFIRTDQTIIGEAILHKFLGIIVLLVVAKIYSIHDIGFLGTNRIFNLLVGFGIGIITFMFAYLIEIYFIIGYRNFARFELYVSSYSVTGNVGKQISFLAFAICILGNIINVIMEEGLFRGLFQKVLERKYSFLIAAIISSLLFGLWHIVSPIRAFYDGSMSFDGLVMNSIILVVTSALVGFQFALMTKISGSLYMAMAYHFVNNTIINILHVVSNIAVDNYMVIRIASAQTISFIIVLIWYIISSKKKGILQEKKV